MNEECEKSIRITLREMMAVTDEWINDDGMK